MSENKPEPVNKLEKRLATRKQRLRQWASEEAYKQWMNEKLGPVKPGKSSKP